MEEVVRSITFQIIILILLITIDGLLSASEIAYISMSKQHMKKWAQEGNKKAQKVLNLVEDQEYLISSVQSIKLLTEIIAIVYYTAIIIGQSGSSNILSFISSIELQIVVFIILITTLFVVFGIKLPRRIAAQIPDKVALKLVNFVRLIKIIFKPFAWLINSIIVGIQKVLPIDFNERNERFTRDEMQAILLESHSEGSIDIDEFTMLEGVLSLDEKIAKDVMVPRTDAQMLNVDDDIKENIDEILESPYSRIPLYKEDRDNVIGVLHTKTLLKTMRLNDEEKINLLNVSFDPLFVPSTMYIDDLLVEFKRHQQHMAILIDEYGGVEGIVTMEDLLEEIVGEIDDENDIERIGDIRRIDANNAFVNAGIDIEDFNKYYRLNISEDDIDTLAGAIIREIGYVPSRTERIRIRVRDYVIQTLRVESGRIYTVKITEDPTQAIYTDYEIEEEVNEE